MTIQNSDPSLALFLTACEAQRKTRQRQRRLARQAKTKSDRINRFANAHTVTPIKRSLRQEKGDQYEHQAIGLLEQAGMTLLATQLTCPFGEIDLIARDGADLVFIEVRARASIRFGGAAASVTAAKQRKLIQTAKWWLSPLTKKHFNNKEPSCRFDVIAFESTEVFWLKDAIRIRPDK